MSDKIHSAIIAIMRAVGPIAKDQTNTQQNFKYRGVDQVYNACHPHFAEHGVYCTSEILEATHSQYESSKGAVVMRAVLKMRFTFRADDGSSVSTEVMGEGHDYGGDKASNKAMSVASKYAILQLLQIPTAMIDSDASSPPPPARTATTPRVTPRQERITDNDELAIRKEWARRHAGPDRDENREKYGTWVQIVTGRVFDPSATKLWTKADVEACRAALESEQRGGGASGHS